MSADMSALAPRSCPPQCARQAFSAMERRALPTADAVTIGGKAVSSLPRFVAFESGANLASESAMLADCKAD